MGVAEREAGYVRVPDMPAIRLSIRTGNDGGSAAGRDLAIGAPAWRKEPRRARESRSPAPLSLALRARPKTWSTRCRSPRVMRASRAEPESARRAISIHRERPRIGATIRATAAADARAAEALSAMPTSSAGTTARLSTTAKSNGSAPPVYRRRGSPLDRLRSLKKKSYRQFRVPIQLVRRAS